MPSGRRYRPVVTVATNDRATVRGATTAKTAMQVVVRALAVLRLQPALIDKAGAALATAAIRSGRAPPANKAPALLTIPLCLGSAGFFYTCFPASECLTSSPP